MSLENAYSQVNNTNSFNIPIPFGKPPVFERDPNLIQLENNVFQQMLNALPKEEPVQHIQQQTVSFISFEDALRELQNMHK